MGWTMHRADSDETFPPPNLDRLLDPLDDDDPRIVVDIVAPVFMAGESQQDDAVAPLPDALAGWYYTG